MHSNVIYKNIVFLVVVFYVILASMLFVDHVATYIQMEREIEAAHMEIKETALFDQLIWAIKGVVYEREEEKGCLLVSATAVSSQSRYLSNKTEFRYSANDYNKAVLVMNAPMNGQMIYCIIINDSGIQQNVSFARVFGDDAYQDISIHSIYGAIGRVSGLKAFRQYRSVVLYSKSGTPIVTIMPDGSIYAE